MKFKVWETIISKDSIVITKVTQDESNLLTVTVENSNNDTCQIKSRVELFEVGEEQHYFDLWLIMNQQLKSKNRTTLILDNSDWIDRFSYLRDNKSIFNHYLIIGISKVVQFISETDPIIKMK